MITETQITYALNKRKRILNKKKKERSRDKVFFHEIDHVNNFVKYFLKHINDLPMHCKKLLSNNNWYLQREENGNVITSTRLFSVEPNQKVPLLFQDKKSSFYEKKQNFKEKTGKSFGIDDPHDDSDIAAHLVRTLGHDDEEHQENELILVDDNDEDDYDDCDDEDDEDEYEDSDDESYDNTTVNQKFGLIAYNMNNTETVTDSIVTSDPPGPDELEFCEFDEESAKFVHKYVRGIRKSFEKQQVKKDVASWAQSDLPKRLENGKLQSAAEFVKSKYGDKYKNCYQRVLQLNTEVQKTPFSKYLHGPYSSFTDEGNNHSDENHLVNNLPLLPSLTTIASAKYAMNNVDQAQLNKLATLATANNDPEEAEKTIIKNYLIRQKKEKENKKSAAQAKKSAKARASLGDKSVAEDNPPHDDENNEDEVDEEDAHSIEEVGDSVEDILSEVMALENVCSKYRQLNISANADLVIDSSIIHIAKSKNHDSNTFGILIKDTQLTLRKRRLEVKLVDGEIVEISPNEAYLLQLK